MDEGNGVHKQERSSFKEGNQAIFLYYEPFGIFRLRSTLTPYCPVSCDKRRERKYLFGTQRHITDEVNCFSKCKERIAQIYLGESFSNAYLDAKCVFSKKKSTGRGFLQSEVAVTPSLPLKPAHTGLRPSFSIILPLSPPRYTI